MNPDFISISHSLTCCLLVWSLSRVVLGNWHPLPLWLLLVCFLSHSFLLGLSNSQPYSICLCLPEIWGDLPFTECSSPVLFIVAELYLSYTSHPLYLLLSHIFSGVYRSNICSCSSSVQMDHIELSVDIFSKTKCRTCPCLGFRQVNEYSLNV